MNADDISWDDWRVFLASWRAQSLSGAAKRLGINQSTASRRLAQLEERLGVPLFDRLPRGLSPTPASAALAPIAEQMEAGAAQLAQVAMGHDRTLEGTVRVAAPLGFAVEVIAPSIVDLRARHPGLNVALLAGTEIVDLTRREADIALRVVKPQRGDLVGKRLGVLHRRPYATRGYLKARLGTETPGRIDPNDVDWVGLDDSLSHMPEARWLERLIDVEPVLKTNAWMLKERAVFHGVGAGVLLDIPARLADVVALDLGVPDPPSLDLWLVTHRHLRQVPRIAAVWAWLSELVAEILA